MVNKDSIKKAQENKGLNVAETNEIVVSPIEETEEDIVVNTEEGEGSNVLDLGDDEAFDFSQFRGAKSVSISREIGEAGVMSIVNSKSNGKRISLSKDLLDRLNNPESVQFAFNTDSVVIGEKLPIVENSFSIRKDKKGIIYASQLVEEITKEFSLDFSNRTSVTFHQAKYRTMGNYIIAIVKIK
jgi:hypothetical protein